VVTDTHDRGERESGVVTMTTVNGFCKRVRRAIVPGLYLCMKTVKNIHCSFIEELDLEYFKIIC